MAKLLIKNAEIISAKDNGKYYIGIEDNLIKTISKELPQEFEGAEIIDADGKIAVPGMVNTHTHAAMTLLRSYADDMVLMDWLQNKIWPAEDGLTGHHAFHCGDVKKRHNLLCRHVFFHGPRGRRRC